MQKVDNAVGNSTEPHAQFKTTSRAVIEMWFALTGAGKSFFKSMPLLTVLLAMLVLWTLAQLLAFGHVMLSVLGATVTIIAIAQFHKSKSLVESTISFLIGILTVFTVEWSRDKFWLFVVLYWFFNVYAFLASSMKVNAQVEGLLSDAALQINPSKWREILKQLQVIHKESTKLYRLTHLEKAEVIRLLAYYQIPIDTMPMSIKIIEVFKMQFSVDYSDAAALIQTILVVSPTNEAVEQNLAAVEESLPLLPIPPANAIKIMARSRSMIKSAGISLMEFIVILKLIADYDLEPSEILKKMRVVLESKISTVEA